MLLCVVCQGHERGVVLVPCFHFALCSICAPGISECPLCREGVQERKRMVISCTEVFLWGLSRVDGATLYRC